MRAALLILLSIIFFTSSAQVRRDTIMSGSKMNAKSVKLSDLPAKRSELLSGVTDSTFIDIYHSDKQEGIDFPPAMFVDSVRVKSIPIINANDIIDLKVYGGRDSINKTHGKIYITLKKRSYHFITIEDLTKRAIPNFDKKTQPVIYLVDDKLITDTAGMTFEITHIRNVEVVDGSNIKAFQGLLSNVILIRINTESAPNYIKGSPSPALFKQ